MRPHTGLINMPLAPSADNNYGYDFNTRGARRSTSCRRTLDTHRADRFCSRRQRGATSQLSRSTTVADAVNRWLVATASTSTACARTTRSPTPSQLANVQALAYGLVPASAAPWEGTSRASVSRSSRIREWNFCGRCTLQGSTRTWSDSTDASARLGLDSHPWRHFLLGGLGTERPDRRQHVPRMGFIGSRSDAGGSARRRTGDPDCWRPPDGARDLTRLRGPGQRLGRSPDDVRDGLGLLGGRPPASTWPSRCPRTPPRFNAYSRSARRR